MIDSLRLYFRYVAVSLRGHMQYRASFVMLSIGFFFTGGIGFLGLWALFARFKTLKGWSLAEAALFYGLVNTAFGAAEIIGRGFDLFPNLVRSGDFDRLLLRPRSTALQIAASDMYVMKIGRLLQGLVVLLWAAAALDVDWTALRVALTLFALLGGTCMFVGLFILQATAAFWTIQSLEVMNILTYGGSEMGSYPLTIYRPWFRTFFIFVVPLACVTYFPALAILGRDDPVVASPVWFRWAAPAVGVLFLLVTLQVWKFGVRHYRSTGS